MHISRRTFIQSASAAALALPNPARLLAAAWHPPSPIEGEPLSIVTERHFARYNPDGSQTDTLQSTSRLYRDSDGRVRTEVGELHPSTSIHAPHMVSISDPIAVRWYHLDTNNRTVRTQVWAGDVNVDAVTMPFLIDQSSTLAVYNRKRWYSEHPDFSSMNLGDDIILGEPVTGRRRTMIFPVGSVDDNPKPIIVTLDIWTSKELRLTMLSKLDDPREGATTVRVTQLDCSDPDPSLFRVPPDYKVVD